MRAEIVEVTKTLHKFGKVSDEDLKQTTLRMLGPGSMPKPPLLTSKQIVAIRESERMSQAVFARVLGVSTGTLSKWERGEQNPSGPARRLLQIIKAKGVTGAF